MTLPVILAYARGSAEERKFWEEGIAGFRTEDADFAHALELVGRHGAVQATRERARHFAERACDALAIFPDSRAKAAMVGAARFAVSRGY
jgi:octaprenyl-diphosphate synthase